MAETLYTFKDEFPDPDPIARDYEQFEDTQVPIVIDNGDRSWTCLNLRFFWFHLELSFQVLSNVVQAGHRSQDRD